eukprot:gb/GECG01006374.1/.p1 GENE.gb/GECG01006374.1/~~gb/GECG01006374.1/.p1  ORF type:complete len:528 (+),score=102.44 gb/GECG01006374.1/:1-1584(+)
MSVYTTSNAGPTRSSQGSSGKQKTYIEVRNPQFSEDGKTVHYEVCCMRKEPVPGKLQDVTYKWSFWSRYSDFQELHKALEKNYGWRMKGIKLPPTKLVGNKKPEFLQQRMQQLQEYLRNVCEIENAVNFESNKCSKDLKQFLKYDERHKGMQTRKGSTSKQTGGATFSRSYSVPASTTGAATTSSPKQDASNAPANSSTNGSGQQQAEGLQPSSQTVSARPPMPGSHQEPQPPRNQNATPDMTDQNGSQDMGATAGGGGSSDAGAGLLASIREHGGESSSKPAGGGRGDLMASIKNQSGTPEKPSSGAGRGGLMAGIRNQAGALPNRGRATDNLDTTGAHESSNHNQDNETDNNQANGALEESAKDSSASQGGGLMDSIKQQAGAPNRGRGGKRGGGRGGGGEGTGSMLDEIKQQGGSVPQSDESEKPAPKKKSSPPPSGGGGGGGMAAILQAGGKPSQVKKGRAKAAAGASGSDTAEKPPIEPKKKKKPSFKPKGPPPDKGNLLSAIQQGKSLNKAETVDKSGPVV